MVIGDVRGHGLMMAAELVINRKPRELDPESMARLVENTRKFGAYRNLLRICPPLYLQMQDVAFFEEAINESFEEL